MPNKKKRYYQTGGVVESLMDPDSIQTNDQSIKGKIVRDLGREEISNTFRDRFEDISGIGALRRIRGAGVGDTSRSGVSRVARILSKLRGAAPGASPTKMEYMPPRRPFRGRMGGWDNRLRGPEEARESAGYRASRDRIRALRDSVRDERKSGLPIRDFSRRLRDAIGPQGGRASGGIVGLNSGGRIPRYAFGGAWGGGKQGGVQTDQGGGWQGGGQQQQNRSRPPPPGGWQGGGGQQQGGAGMGQAGMGRPPVQPQPPAFQPYQAQAVPAGYGSPAQFTGYGGPTQMGVSQSFVSPEVASQYADLTQSIMNVGTRPFEQYQGPQLAAFTPAEAAAQAAHTAIGTGQGPQGTLQAESTLGEAATGIGGLAPQQARVAHKFGAFAPLAQEQAEASAQQISDIGAKVGAPGMMTDVDPATGESVLDPYASQYTQGVIDPQIRAIREEAERQRSEMGSQAAGAGAFGGYRHGLGEQAAGQAATQQIADVTAKGREEAFRSSQEAFRADREAQAAGYGQQLGAQQQAGAMQQKGFGTMADLYRGQQGALGAEAGLYGQLASVGGQQAALGGQQQQQLSQRLANMQRAGAGQRELQQAAIDIRRQQWEQQRQHPERQAQWIGQMLGNLPYQNIQQQAAYAPQVGALPSAIGAGIAGAGLWNQFQANRPPQGEPLPPWTPNTPNLEWNPTYQSPLAGNK